MNISFPLSLSLSPLEAFLPPCGQGEKIITTEKLTRKGFAKIENLLLLSLHFTSHRIYISGTRMSCELQVAWAQKKYPALDIARQKGNTAESIRIFNSLAISRLGWSSFLILRFAEKSIIK